MTASVNYETTLRCDAPGCKRFFRHPTRWEYTRKVATVEGWSCDAYKGDFCPTHADDRQEQAVVFGRHSEGGSDAR